MAKRKHPQTNTADLMPNLGWLLEPARKPGPVMSLKDMPPEKRAEMLRLYGKGK